MKCWKSYQSVGNIFHCDFCTNMHVHRYGNEVSQGKEYSYKINHVRLPGDSGVCDQCGTNYVLNGPIWLDNICNLEFLQTLQKRLKSVDFDMELKTHKRILGMINGLIEEMEIKNCNPLGFDISKISSIVKINNISKKKCM